ncbi:MAG: DUF802 domain-containing protein [Pseudoxanthomonas spadix]|nr:MAG: DUF802 domain-containing protein [Pseudoxanthomonas spadix]
MPRTVLNLIVFLLGLLAVGWVGAGYLGNNALGVAVSLVIAACYIAGAIELYRYRQATRSLELALREDPTAAAGIPAWLERLAPGLRQPVRLRIEGARVALPAPTLTPYLTGLLVLLGMLGTLLGMMATLRGTGLALESAIDLQAMRGSLAAPVKGLGFAFGTSIAGVATSAMLGLLSALCRRERLEAVQQLDAAIATSLHPHSRAHRQEEAFRLQQAQTALMPQLIEQLGALMQTIQTHSSSTHAQLVERHEVLHARTEAAHVQLSEVLARALAASVADSAQAVNAALQPVVERTLTGLARDAQTLQASVRDAVQQQLDALDRGFAGATSAARDSWTAALDTQRQAHAAQVLALQQALDGAGQALSTHATRTVEAIGARLDGTAQQLDTQWTQALAQQRELHAAQAAQHAQALEQAGSAFQAHTAALLDHARQAQAQLHDTLTAQAERGSAQLEAASAAFARHGAETASAFEAHAGDLARTADDTRQQLRDALAQQAEQHARQLREAAAAFDQHTATVAEALTRSHTALQDALAAQDGQRLAAWSEALASTHQALREEWRQAGAETAQRQQAICDTLAQTAEAITGQAQTHAQETIAQITRLVDAAAEAPRAAAEVIAELRQKLSDSMVRDTELLAERNQLMSTLDTLLDAVNHASTEQRGAIDALVSTSAQLLERVGTRFTDHVEAQTGKLEQAAAQVGASATEVASLGDAFGAAVAQFGQANAELTERLHGIEQALDKSLARSDEQLAYYVAQAREVIDLSLLSQRQIIEDLRQLGDARSTAA